MEQAVDLRDHMNERLIWSRAEAQPSAEHPIGIDNSFFFEEDVPVGKWLEIEEDRFRFDRNGSGDDFIRCASQRICLPEAVRCDEIAFAGTCDWGYFAETCELIFTDGERELASFALNSLDWCFQNYTQSQEKIGKDLDDHLRRSRIFLVSKVPRGTSYLYHSTCRLKSAGKRVREIVLTDNFFVHIGAITLRADCDACTATF